MDNNNIYPQLDEDSGTYSIEQNAPGDEDLDFYPEEPKPGPVNYPAKPVASSGDASGSINFHSIKIGLGMQLRKI